jgi:hypothetical protein
MLHWRLLLIAQDHRRLDLDWAPRWNVTGESRTQRRSDSSTLRRQGGLILAGCVGKQHCWITLDFGLVMLMGDKQTPQTCAMRLIYKSCRRLSAQTCFPSLPVKTRCAINNLGRESSGRQALDPSGNRAGWNAATPGRDASRLYGFCALFFRPRSFWARGLVMRAHTPHR